MPHQCLNCGDTFAEGSADLLDGCPSCEGTRFFYTEDPLEAEEREELKDQTDEDVETMLREIVEDDETPDLGEEIWSRQAWEEWIKRKTGRGGDDPDEVDVSFDQIADSAGSKTTFEPEGVAEEPAQVSDPEPAASAEGTEEAEPVQVELGDVEETRPPEEEAQPPASGDSRRALQPAPQPDDDGRPSTLNINDPGEYEIDVRRLLEDSPVIVERDGSYVIHLPSVFERSE